MEIHNIYAAPAADLETPTNGCTQQYFYVVSIKKFLVLFWATTGFYLLYWFYKNWATFRDATRDSIWPVPRAIFSIFFVHSLFEKIAYRLEKREPGHVWNYKATASLIVVLMIVQRALEFFPTKENGPLLPLLYPVIIVFAISPFLITAQKKINASEGDSNGELNSKFTVANIIWIVLGLILWYVSIMGAFILTSTLMN